MLLENTIIYAEPKCVIPKWMAVAMYPNAEVIGEEEDYEVIRTLQGIKYVRKNTLKNAIAHIEGMMND